MKMSGCCPTAGMPTNESNPTSDGPGLSSWLKSRPDEAAISKATTKLRIRFSFPLLAPTILSAGWQQLKSIAFRKVRGYFPRMERHSTIEVKEETKMSLQEYANIPIAFQVKSI